MSIPNHEIETEVNRNVILSHLVIVGCFLMMLVVSYLFTDLAESPWFKRIILMRFVMPSLMAAAIILVLAYPMGCWGGFIRLKRLPQLLAVDSDDVAATRLLERASEPGDQSAFDRGGKLVVLFMMCWIVLDVFGLRVVGKHVAGLNFGMLFLWIMGLFQAGKLTARARAVERAIEGQRAESTGLHAGGAAG